MENGKWKMKTILSQVMESPADSHFLSFARSRR